MESIGSVGVCKALWTYRGLDPIYHFSCPLRVDNAGNLLSLQLWHQINYRILFLLRNGIKGISTAPSRIRPAHYPLPLWVSLLGSDRSRETLSEFEFSCVFLVFLTFLLFLEGRTTAQRFWPSSPSYLLQVLWFWLGFFPSCVLRVSMSSLFLTDRWSSWFLPLYMPLNSLVS